jgi:hypothetical protein
MDDPNTMLISLCIISVVLVIFFPVVALLLSTTTAINEVKRTHKLERVAAQLSFTFHGSDDGSFQQSLPKFKLFARGKYGALDNRIGGQFGAVMLTVCDYRYRVPSGKHTSTHHQTIVCLGKPGSSLPVFWLQPEHIFHKIGSWFGLQDIDFPDHPVFSASYLLQGHDESAIQAHFTREVIEYFEMRSDLCVEANDNQLLVYRQSVLVAAEEIRAFAEDCVRLFSLLTI